MGVAAEGSTSYNGAAGPLPVEGALPARETMAATTRVRYWYPRPLLLTLAATAGIFASSGDWAQAILIAYGILAVGLALSLAAEGVTMLIMIASVDGIAKGVLPGWYTLLMKDVVLWACVARWVFLRAQGYRSEALHTRTATLILIFVGWVLVEAANLTTQSALVALAGVRSWVGWVPVFFVMYDDVRTRREILPVFVTVVMLAAVVGLYGIIQQQIGYDHLLSISRNFSYVYKMGIVGGVYRSTSTLPHPGIFGHYMATMLPMALALGMAPLLPARFRWLCLGSTIFIAGGAVTSGARLAAAAMLSTIVVVVLLARQARGLFLGAVVVMVFGYVGLRLAAPEAVYRMSFLFNTRLTLARLRSADLIPAVWVPPGPVLRTPLQRGWSAAMENPLGVGVATGMAVGRAWQFMAGGKMAGVNPEAAGMIEGDYGRAFRELGLPGGILFLMLIGHVVLQSFRDLRRTRPPPWRYFSAGLFAMLVSEELALLVGPAFYLMPVAALFWVAFGALRRVGLTPDEELAAEPARAPALAAAAF